MLLQQKDVLWDLRPESRLHNTDSRHCARSWQKEGEDEGLREEVLEHWCGGARSPEGPERVGGGIHSRHRAFLSWDHCPQVPEVWEKASHPVIQVGKERT